MAALMEGRNIIVTGVANERSIAWGVVKSLHRAGAGLIFTYRKQRSYERLTQLLDKHGIQPLYCASCDATDDGAIASAMGEIAERIPVVHGFVHSIAYAEKEELQGEYADTSREGFLLAHETSAYSLVAWAKACKPFMTEGGSIVTQSYLGAERVVKNYNVMGVAKASLEASVRYLAEDLGKYRIRVNAISSGPIRTLSAKGGVSGFTDLLGVIERKAPLRRNVDQDEVGDATMFLLSDLARGITGEVLHVDSGYHVLG
ncbi:enoyl-ACP reductase FabI [Paenibacillus sp. J5C_2022]|uniref:enoyl-ACP reductase FabI n=1 Tax=Paenibacillus sp. J5C2022 TaxID=2977129 RepID=UPI0021D30950|nr:enoyl-ACP reductase FabI [Paenibacillus sp. J5C2022]MCU6710572.1 enoyl-ACP reductase FabI [Paenibacillus sp. J5C2022]